MNEETLCLCCQGELFPLEQRQTRIEIIDLDVLSFEDWKEAFGVCMDCGVSIIQIDRESWLDDKCHRHKFMRLME